jgi:hypothetical protein
MAPTTSRRKTAAVFLSVWLTRVAQGLLFFRSLSDGETGVFITGIVISSLYWVCLLVAVARKTGSWQRVVVRVVLGWPDTQHSGGGVDVIATSTTFLNYWMLILFGILILRATIATEALPWAALWMVITSSNLIFTYDDDNDLLASVLLQFGYSASVALFVVARPHQVFYLAVGAGSGIAFTLAWDWYRREGFPKTLSLAGFILFSPCTEPLNSELAPAIIIWASWGALAMIGLDGQLDDRFQPQLDFFILACTVITGKWSVVSRSRAWRRL